MSNHPFNVIAFRGIMLVYFSILFAGICSAVRLTRADTEDPVRSFEAAGDIFSELYESDIVNDSDDVDSDDRESLQARVVTLHVYDHDQGSALKYKVTGTYTGSVKNIHDSSEAAIGVANLLVKHSRKSFADDVKRAYILAGFRDVVVTKVDK